MGNFSSRPRRPSQAPPAQFDSIEPTPGPAVGIPVATASVVSPPAAGATPAATSDARITLQVTSDKTALAHGAQQSLVAMLSLRAPASAAEQKRPPIDLVACIDRSGSMHGEKMKLMKQTLELLVTRAGLNGDDRISLVTFDREVKLDMPLEPMSADGRAKAESVVKSVHPGSTTNLSGGALKAIDVLDASASRGAGLLSAFAKGGLSPDEKKDGGRTRAVMLFTDGLANEGITDPSQIVSAVGAALRAASARLGGPISLYTFGFGSDHNESCLRSLATESGASGLYYYVSRSDDIPNAFADCLGGLTSVVAQNASLTLDGLAGATVTRVLGSTYKRNAEGAIELGDLFSEDQKDVLVELALPKLPAPSPDPAPVLAASLRAFSVVRSAPEVAEAALSVGRPAATPADQPVNTALDAQRNRIEAAEAMEAASRLADDGNLAEGRTLLRTAKAKIGSSSSAQAKNHVSLNLFREMDELEEQYVSTAQYRSIGSKMSKMSAMSHARQRAVHTSAPEAGYGGGAARKRALKASWLSSIKGDDSDSD